jgi:hypothetical protein
MTTTTQTFLAKAPKARKNSFLSMFRLRSSTVSKRNTVPEMSLDISTPVNLCPALEQKATAIMKEEKARAKMAARKSRLGGKSWKGMFSTDDFART